MIVASNLIGQNNSINQRKCFIQFGAGKQERTRTSSYLHKGQSHNILEISTKGKRLEKFKTNLRKILFHLLTPSPVYKIMYHSNTALEPFQNLMGTFNRLYYKA